MVRPGKNRKKKRILGKLKENSEKRKAEQAKKKARTAVSNWAALGRNEEMLEKILETHGVDEKLKQEILTKHSEGKLSDEMLVKVLTGQVRLHPVEKRVRQKKLKVNEPEASESLAEKVPEVTEEMIKAQSEEGAGASMEEGVRKKAKEELTVSKTTIVAPTENPYLDKFVILIILAMIILGIAAGVLGWFR